MKERAEMLREDVRKIVNGSTELRETIDLIITLQRLGLDYYYETEIDKLLHDICNLDCSDKDLNLVSLRFYLLRKNNYDVSSGKTLLLDLTCQKKILKRNKWKIANIHYASMFYRCIPKF